MQSNRNFLAALPLLLLSSLTACTGTVEGPAPPAGLVPSGGAANIPGAGAGPVQAGGMSGVGGSAALPALPVWTGTVGSWCGPGDNSSVWLVARPQASACDVSSKKVYSTEMMEDVSEGLTLQLDTMQLTTFPAQLSVPGRFCAAAAVGGGCSDVVVALSVESYTQGQGVMGTWTFTPLGQAELKGRLEASWCNWDDFLPAHPEGERLA